MHIVTPHPKDLLLSHWRPHLIWQLMLRSQLTAAEAPYAWMIPFLTSNAGPPKPLALSPCSTHMQLESLHRGIAEKGFGKKAGVQTVLVSHRTQSDNVVDLTLHMTLSFQCVTSLLSIVPLTCPFPSIWDPRSASWGIASPVWRSLKWWLRFLDSLLINVTDKMVSYYCVFYYMFVRRVLCLWLITFWQGPQSDNITEIKFPHSSYLCQSALLNRYESWLFFSICLCVCFSVFPYHPIWQYCWTDNLKKSICSSLLPTLIKSLFVPCIWWCFFQLSYR